MLRADPEGGEFWKVLYVAPPVEEGQQWAPIGRWWCHDADSIQMQACDYSCSSGLSEMNLFEFLNAVESGRLIILVLPVNVSDAAVW